jgi:hypothetical protein
MMRRVSRENPANRKASIIMAQGSRAAQSCVMRRMEARLHISEVVVEIFSWDGFARNTVASSATQGCVGVEDRV